MTSKQHNRSVIKKHFKDYNLSNEVIEKIRVFSSERYVEGLKQKEFDITMDLEQQLQTYKDKEDKLRELIEKDYADIKEDFNKGFAFGKEMDYVWWLRERFLKIIDGSDGE